MVLNSVLNVSPASKINIFLNDCILANVWILLMIPYENSWYCSPVELCIGIPHAVVIQYSRSILVIFTKTVTISHSHIASIDSVARGPKLKCKYWSYPVNSGVTGPGSGLGVGIDTGEGYEGIVAGLDPGVDPDDAMEQIEGVECVMQYPDSHSF